MMGYGMKKIYLEIRKKEKRREKKKKSFLLSTVCFFPVAT
jgi:nitrate reductase NapE component